MENKTQKFEVEGYFMNMIDVAIVATFKVNSAKQAKERFLKKYESSLAGDWSIRIKNNHGKTLLKLTKNEEGEWEVPSDNDIEEREREALLMFDTEFTSQRRPRRPRRPFK